MGKKILITPRSLTQGGHPALKPIAEAGYELVFCAAGRQPGEDELLGLVPGCIGWLAGVEKISARVLEAADSLLVISRNGTGVDNIDLPATEAKGIRVCRAEGANARGVAELALGLILALARSIPYSDATLKQHEWQRRMGFELEGHTLGLVGCGRIGRLVADFALALGMRVRAFDPFPDLTRQPAGDFAYASLDDVLATADVISLHCPPPARGRPLIGPAEVARMRQGVCLVNTARAELLDEAAIADGLADGRIAGVAVDVHQQEPPASWRLIDNDRVIATPHVGGYTGESVTRAVSEAVRNLLEALD